MVETIHNLTYELARLIGIDIVNEVHFEQHAVTTMRAISEEYQVGLNTAREALKILYAKGLVSLNKRIGIIISPREEWNLFDSDVLNWILESRKPAELFKEITELRLAIEPEAAQLAAAHRLSPQALMNLQNILRQIDRAAPASHEMLAAELDFHTAILIASGNPYFLQMEKIIKKSITLKFILLNSSRIAITSNQTDYHVIVQAIFAQDGLAAFQASSQLAKKDYELAKLFIQPKRNHNNIHLSPALIHG